jgi:E3 ubiquitin-protein ligase SHPRH
VKWLLAEHGPADGRALLFSAWVGVLDVLSHALAANGVRAAQPRGPKALGDAIAAFRRGDPARRDPAVLLMPVRAGANGLNLTEAAHVLLVEPQADPAVEAQAAGRVHRIGQTRPTTVHRFVVEGTVEEGVDRLARARRAALAAGGGGGGETGGGEEATAAALAAAGAPTSRAHHGEPALSVADVVRLLQHGGGRRVGGEEGRE